MRLIFFQDSLNDSYLYLKLNNALIYCWKVLKGFSKKSLIYSFVLILAPYEKDLCTKMVQIPNKRYYLDVKENRRGKFIKVGFAVV